MSRRRLERELDSLRDGRLEEARARELEQLLASDAEAGRQLRSTRALGSLVREAWNDGPPAPASDLLLRSLRPELARIDREIEDSGLRRPFARLGAFVGPWIEGPRLVPTAATAAVALVAFLAMPLLEDGNPVTVTAAVQPPPSTAPALSPTSPASTIYDLEAADGSVAVFEGEEGTLIWLHEDEGFSWDSLAGGWA